MEVLSGVGVEVQQLQRFSGDEADLAVFGGNAAQYPSAALGGFEEQQPGPGVVAGVAG